MWVLNKLFLIAVIALVLVNGQLQIKTDILESVNVNFDSAKKALKDLNIENSPNAVKLIADNFASVLNLTEVLKGQMDETIEKGQKISEKDPAAATDLINNVIKNITNEIYFGTAPLIDAHGRALKTIGKGAMPALVHSLVLIENSGTNSIDGINSVATVLSKGYKAGGAASVEATKSAHKIVNKVVQIVIKNWLEGVSSLTSFTPDNASTTANVSNSKSNDSVEISVQAQEAIDNLERNAKDATSNFNESSALKAEDLVKNGLIYTIREIAQALPKVDKIIKDAKESQDVNQVQNEVRSVNDDFSRAFAKVYLLAGRAGQEIGDGDKVVQCFEPFIVHIDTLRVQFYFDLQQFEKSVTKILKASGPLDSQGLSSTQVTLQEAADSLYTQLVDAEKEAIEAISKC